MSTPFTTVLQDNQTINDTHDINTTHVALLYGFGFVLLIGLVIAETIFEKKINNNIIPI